MTLRNVPNSFTLEQQRQEVNEIAVDLDTAVDGVQTFGGSKTFSNDVTFQAQTFWGDGDQAVFGDDSDFKIYYDGDAGVQTSFIDSDALIIRSESDSDEKYITALKDGPVELYHNGVKKFATNLTGAAVLGDLEVGNELHSSDGALYLKTADQITPGQMVTEAIFGGSMYVPYGFSTYPISYFPGGNIDETSTNAGFSVSSGGQIYIANISAQALWKGRQVGTPGLTSEIDAAGNAEFAGMVKCDSILSTASTPTFSIFNTGNALFEDVEATSLHMKDDRPAHFGTNEDASLYYHNSSSDLRLDSEVGFRVRWYDTVNTQYEDQAVFSPFGSTSFYYQGAASPTLSIDDGVDIRGDVTLGTIADPSELKMYVGVSSGSTNYLKVFGGSNEVYFRNVDGSGAGGTINIQGRQGVSLWQDTGNLGLQVDSSCAVKLYYSTSEKLKTTTNGVEITGTLDVSGIGTFDDTVNAADSHVQLLLDSGNGRLKLTDASDAVTVDIFGSNGDISTTGNITLSDDTKKVTTQKIEPVTPGSIMYIGSTDSGSSIAFQSPNCVFDEIGFSPFGGLKLGIASGTIPTGATNGVLKTYLDGDFIATCDNGITLNVANDKLQWTRIGNLITVMGQIQIDSSNGGSALTINNLPYSVHSTGDGAGYAVGAVRLYNASIATDHNYVICMADIGTTNLLFQAVRDNTTTESLPTSDGAYYAFSITYRAA